MRIYFEFIKLMIISYLTILVIYIIGEVINRTFKILKLKNYYALNNLVIGIFSVISIYSILKTNFNTINLALPILLIILKYTNKIDNNINEYENDVDGNTRHYQTKIFIKITLILLIPIFIIQSSYYFDFSNKTYRPLHNDHYIYADYVTGLRLNGIESVYTDLNLITGKKILLPYHYGELWFASFVSELFNISSISSYFIVTITCLATIFSFGWYSILNRYNNISLYLKYLLSILSVLSSGIFFKKFYDVDWLNFDSQALNGILSLFGQKNAIVHFIILYFTILFIDKKFITSTIILSTIPILSINFLPGIAGGIVIFSILSSTFEHKFNRNLILSLFTINFIILFIFLFYKIFNKSFHDEIFSRGNHYLFKIYRLSLSISDIKILLGNLFFLLIRPFIYYLLFIPLFIIFLRNFPILAVYYFLILLSGAISAIILWGIPNTSQFCTNLYILFNIMVIFGLSRFNSYKDLNIKYKIFNLVGYFYIGLILWSYFFIIHRNKMDNKADTDQKLVKKINDYINSFHYDNKLLIVWVYLSKADYNSIPSLLLWSFKNDILSITQLTNKDIVFSLLNPQDFFKYNDKYNIHDTIYCNIHPITNLKSKKFSDIPTMNSAAQFLYFKGTIPDYFFSLVDTCLHSEFNNSWFCQIKN